MSPAHPVLQSPLWLRALVLGALTGAALILVAMFSTRGPLMFLPYAVMFGALAQLCARYRSERFLARAGAAFAAFLVATVVVYLYIKLFVNPVVPTISFIGLGRFGLVVGTGAILAAAVAFVTSDEDPKRVGTNA